MGFGMFEDVLKITLEQILLFGHYLTNTVAKSKEQGVFFRLWFWEINEKVLFSPRFMSTNFLANTVLGIILNERLI